MDINVVVVVVFITLTDRAPTISTNKKLHAVASPEKFYHYWLTTYRNDLPASQFKSVGINRGDVSKSLVTTGGMGNVLGGMMTQHDE